MAWNDLTEREKQLDRMIDNCGVKINNSDSCVKKVMAAIGAHNHEADFIRQRIALRLKTSQILGNTDAFIDNTEKMLKDFEEDEKEWERRGRALGFRFWDK